MPRRCRAVPRGLPAARPCNSPHLPSMPMDELQLLPLLGLAASQASNVAHTKIWIIIVNLERHHHRRGRLEAACAVSASRPQRGTPALLIARSCSALCALSLSLCTWAHNPSIAQIQIPDQLPAPSSHPAPPHAVPRANAPSRCYCGALGLAVQLHGSRNPDWIPGPSRRCQTWDGALISEWNSCRPASCFSLPDRLPALGSWIPDPISHGPRSDGTL